MKTVFLVLAMTFAACAPVQTAPPAADSSADGVRLSVERVSAGVIRLALDNGSRSPIGYNLCTSMLQRREGSAWTSVPTGEICTMQLSTLNPGHDATFEKRLPASLPAGEYRYVSSVESPLGTSAVRIATDPFPVR